MRRSICAGILATWLAAQPGGLRAFDAALKTGSSMPSVSQRGIEGLDPAATGIAAPVVGSVPAEPKTTAAAPFEFKISRIRFEGVKVMPRAELDAIARPIEFSKVSLAKLKAFTAAVRKLYQDRGYILARAAVPPQKLKAGGDVRVVISEGVYGEVKVEGNTRYTERFVRRQFSPALRRGVVEESTLQRQLLLLNEYPDLSVRSLFLPGNQPGTSDVVLRVHDRTPFHFGLDYNNYGSPLVGRNRAGLAVWLGDFAFEGDELTARYTEPFPSDSDPLIQGGYSVPVTRSGNRVAYAYSSAATTVGGDLAVLDIRGDAKIHALTWTRPMLRDLSRSANVSAGFVFKDVSNFVLGTTRVSRDNLRELTVSLDSNFVVGKARTLSSLVITQGLGDLFGGNRQGDPESSRVGSGNEFTKWNAEVYHVRDLGHSRFFLGRFSGQVSSDPLAVSEQFALGGPDSVRGYLQSDFLGDSGISTSLELRQLVFSSKDRKLNVQAAAFVDHGDAKLMRPQAGEVGSRSFTGVGAGMRASVGRTSTVRADVGFPLTDKNSLNKDAILYAQLVNRW